MNNNEQNEAIKQIARDNAISNLKKAYNIYGIEGTEDKIKELYINNISVRDYMLKTHYELLKGVLK